MGIHILSYFTHLRGRSTNLLCICVNLSREEAARQSTRRSSEDGRGGGTTRHLTGQSAGTPINLDRENNVINGHLIWHGTDIIADQARIMGQPILLPTHCTPLHCTVQCCDLPIASVIHCTEVLYCTVLVYPYMCSSCMDGPDLPGPAMYSTVLFFNVKKQYSNMYGWP